MSDLLERVRQFPLHVGKQEAIKYLEGREVTYKEAVLATCYLCTSGYDGGTFDCKGTSCPLYYFYRYKDAPKKPKKILSEDHKAKLAAGREKAAKGKGKGAKK